MVGKERETCERCLTPPFRAGESTWRERWGPKIQLTIDHDDGDHLHSFSFFRFSRKYDVPFVAKNTALFRYFLSCSKFLADERDLSILGDR